MAAATITVTNTDSVIPSFSISGPTTVSAHRTYTLTLSGSDPRQIKQWTINWGDATPPQVFKGNPRSVTHVYTRGPNQYIISATVADDQNTYLAGNSVTVTVTA